MEIQTKTAIITGASGELGSHFATALAKNGSKCICHYHLNAKRALSLVEKIIKEGGEAVAIQADLSIPEQVDRLFEDVDGFARASILINSASIFQRKQLLDIRPEEIEKTLSLNVSASFLTTQRFVASLDSSNIAIGKVVNIADIGAELNWANYSLYCASKAAVVSMTKTLAKELAPKVLVNAISPGIVSWPKDFDDNSKQFQIDKIPLARKAQTSEIVDALLFLLKNDYVTGQVLNIDGGRSL